MNDDPKQPFQILTPEQAIFWFCALIGVVAIVTGIAPR